MATGDGEIIRSVSDQRTTTNNESLKRYLFVICFYHRYPETKNIFFWKQENSIFYGYCCAKQSCSYYSTWELLQSVWKSSVCICPPDYFIVRIVERKTVRKQRKVFESSFCPLAHGECWLTAIRVNYTKQPLTFYLQAWSLKKNTEVLFITILNNWQRS